LPSLAALALAIKTTNSFLSVRLNSTASFVTAIGLEKEHENVPDASEVVPIDSGIIPIILESSLSRSVGLVFAGEYEETIPIKWSKSEL
jgi:hypothetical protein